jgi:hypothetical protein
MKNVVIFYYRLEYFMAISLNVGSLVYFSHFGMFGPSKIWKPCCYPMMEKDF